MFGLAAHSNVELLLRQVQEFHPHCIAVVDDAAADRAARELHGMPGAPVLLRGKEGLEELAAMDGSDIVLNAVVGIAGLAATLSAIKSGRDVALANKESLVTGGSLVTDAVRENNVKLLPVDSEHSAIFQCLQDEYSAKSLQKDTVDGLRRAVFRPHAAGAAECYKGRCAAPSQLEHGKQDHH